MSIAELTMSNNSQTVQPPNEVERQNGVERHPNHATPHQKGESSEVDLRAIESAVKTILKAGEHGNVKF